MEFSLEMACEELACWDARLVGGADGAAPIRRLQAGPGRADDGPSTLHVVGPHDLPEALELAKDTACSLVVCGIDSLPLPLAGGAAIVVPGNTDPSGCLARLASMQARLGEWAEGVLARLAARKPLREVFDWAATGFANPLLVSDEYLCTLLNAGRIPAGFYDEFWTPSIEDGYCPVEVFADAWARQGDVLKRESAYVIHDATSLHRDYMAANLLHDGALLGFIDMVAINAPFGAADVFKLTWLAKAVARSIAAAPDERLADGAEDYLRRAMDGKFTPAHALRLAADRLGWLPDAPYAVVCIRESSGLGGHSATMGQVRRRLKALLPQSAAFERDGVIRLVTTAQGDAQALCRKLEREFSRGAQTYRLDIGISSIWKGLENLRIAATQARLCLDGPAVGGGVRAFDGQTGQMLVDSLGGFALACLDNRVLALADSGSPGGREQVRTLMAYLETGCSIARTAEWLNVHRNTVNYRLRRMGEVAGLEVARLGEEPDEILRLMIACRALQSGRIPWRPEPYA